MEVPHIRKRYPRSTSTNRYLDRRTFDGPEYERFTLCGAEVTDRDVAWKDRDTKWTRANCCSACVAVAEQGN